MLGTPTLSKFGTLTKVLLRSGSVVGMTSLERNEAPITLGPECFVGRAITLDRKTILVCHVELARDPIKKLVILCWPLQL